MEQNPTFDLLQLYRARLSAGAAQSPETEKSLYALHQKALDELENSMRKNAREDALRIVQGERRAFGWSFLSGDLGNQAERAFNTLAAELERQP
jgi:hypothetical protein